MALTKVSRGLLSTGIVDNSNATAITLNADESATFSGSVGISTSNPQKTLDVQGEIAISNSANSYWNLNRDDSTGALTISDTGTQRFAITPAGSVGIGVVPETWQSTIDALQVGLGGSFAGNTVNPSRAYLSANYYINSSNQESYIATDEASQYFQNAGTHTFKVAPSGTADSAISWITAATIDNSGNVGIGTSSITNPYSQTPFTDLNINGTWGGVISFKLGGVTKGWVGQRSSGNEDMVIGATAGQELLLYANNAERMRISGYQVRIGGDVTSYTPSLFETSGLSGVDRHNRSMSSGTNSRITGSSQASIMAEGVVAVDTVSAGTILTIPHTSQSNLWRPFMVELMFVTGEYNRATGVLGGYAKCGYSALTNLTGFYQFEVGGNVASVSASGNNLLVSFNTGYTSGLSNYEGVCMYYKVMGITPQYFEAWNATLN